MEKSLHQYTMITFKERLKTVLIELFSDFNTPLARVSIYKHLVGNIFLIMITAWPDLLNNIYKYVLPTFVND